MKPTPRSSPQLGFYLHTSWEFAYPFAVRSWKRDDFQKFFALLSRLGFNLVMFWPLSEAMPAPLSDADRNELEGMRLLVEDAHAQSLEFWATFCANVTSRPEITEKPFKERHLYPLRVDVHLDDPKAKAEYFTHRAQLFQVLDNADAYVTIDGDPGSYPGAQPREFLEVLMTDREVIDRFGTHPQTQKVVPWIWGGWGADPETNGWWNEPLEPLAAPVLDMLKTHMTEPWGLLPGRSIREGHGNSRVMIDLAQRAGLIEQSTLLLYEIIEFEPTPPAVVIQFDDIRRVLREEAPHIEKARGVMGNAQQPLMALPNLFFFARATQQPEYLGRTNDEVLHDLAGFLGGDVELLLPAWKCLKLSLEELPADLPARLRASQLRSEVSAFLPGGAELYLDVLARLVRVRREVLLACEVESDEAARAAGVEALRDWWNVHRYVFSGESGDEFSLQWTHPLLLAPLAARGLI